MHRKKVYIAILFWILSLALVATVSWRVATNEAKNQYESYTVKEIIDFGSGWKFTIANQYLDGGSWDLGFLDSNGYFIFVRIDYSLSVDHEYRQFYLSRSMLNDRDFIEVARGSDLERKVITLMEDSSDLNTDGCKVLPEVSDVVALLKSRDLRIIIKNPQI